MSKKNSYPDRDEGIDGYVKIDRYNPELITSLSAHYKDILTQIGENPEREGLLKTPERIAKAMLYLTHGYDLDAAQSATRVGTGAGKGEPSAGCLKQGACLIA